MKKHLQIFVAIILLFCSCNHTDKNVSNQNSDTKDSIIKKSDTIQDIRKVEVIDYDSIKINGKINFATTEKKLLSSLGKPDSIVTIEDQCGVHFEGRTFFEYYYGLTIFQVYKGQVYLKSIYFPDKRFELSTPKRKLDYNTSLVSIKEFYPKAFRQQHEYNDIEKNIIYKIINIQTQYSPSEDKWVLKFNKGKLIEMEYWMPC